MTPQELKNSILQLAIQGRLAPQRPEEGTAEELYRQIQREKAALVKAGRIKKEKPLPEITEEEVPFEIPEGWKWVRFGEVISLLSGTDFKPEEYNDIQQGIPYITGASSLTTDGVAINRWTETPRVIANKGDILLVCKGSGYGKTVICDIDEAHIARQIMAIKRMNSLVMLYLMYFLNANLGLIKSKGQGVIPGIDRNSVLKLCFPLPPLAEQKRIVAKIEELLPYIDRYEKAWSRLEDFNKRFPTDMQKSILQLAIQGKLVPQRPEEGTGEALYRQIQAEKQSLIRSGQLKKEKPLPEITPDEIPFDIPESWKWVRFTDIAVFLNGDRGKSYPNREEYVSEGIPWINTGHITRDGYLDTKTMNYITPEKYNSLRNGRIVPGDLVYCLRGATFGKTARIEPYSEGAIASSLMIIRLIKLTMREYIFMYLKAPLAYQQLHLYNNGSAQPNLAAKDVAKYLIPLPPLAEQKRIVAKLEELLPLCERLK